MRVTTALTTVMFALLIGMLSAPPADAGKIKRSTTTGKRVTLIANDVADMATVDLLTVPDNRQFIVRGFCVSKNVATGSNLVNSVDGRLLNLNDVRCGPDEGEFNTNAAGPSFGPGEKVQYNNETGGIRDVLVWGDLVKL